jgi:hypothetical protein
MCLIHRFTGVNTQRCKVEIKCEMAKWRRRFYHFIFDAGIEPTSRFITFARI